MAFSQIILESIDISFLKQSCTHITAAFSIQGKKVFHKNYKVFTSAGIAAAMTWSISLKIKKSPYTGLISLEMADSSSYRPQSMVHY